ncbi:MAG: HD domain-containing phosphohydrolase [Bacillota bacterium]
MFGNKDYFPFKYKLSIIMTALIIAAVSLIGFIQYDSVRDSLIEDFDKKIDLLQNIALNSVKDADFAYFTLESELETKMRHISFQILLDYEIIRNPVDMKLDKYITDEDWLEVHLIDENHNIAFTTNPDLKNADLDINAHAAEFYNTIMKNGEYVSDRVNILEEGSNTIKYSYFPTGDKKYIIRLGANLNKFNSRLRDMSMGFENTFKTLKSYDSCIIDVLKYSSEGKSYNPESANMKVKRIADENLMYLKQAAATEYAVEVEKPDGKGNTVFYRYIPYKVLTSKNEGNIDVIEIIYNNASLNSKLSGNRDVVVAVVIAAAVVSVLLGLAISNIVSKPVEKMMGTINSVNKGNFNHSTGIYTHDEFRLLGKSLDDMLHNIKQLIDERELHSNVLLQKNAEIISQKEEITALYEETTAMNEELYNLLDELRENYLNTVRALAKSIEAKDHYTKGHCERVTSYAIKVGKKLGLTDPELNELEFACLLHDIGKIGIPDGILNKESKLTDEEFDIIKKHSEIGSDIIKDVEFLENSSKVLLQHHERVDGKGYPYGLKHNEILRMARILAVADAYDAMTSSRPYRKDVMTKEQAIEQFLANKNTQFDPEIVDEFIKILNEEE